MFDELFIYNYFPTDIGEAETRTREISTLKMAMIHAIMGEDTKILTSDEELKSIFRRAIQEIESGRRTAIVGYSLRAELNQLIHSDAMKEALALPLRAKTCRKTGDEGNKGILVFARKGSDCVFKFAPVNDQPVDLSPQEAFDRLRCGMDEKGYAVTDDFEERYIEVKKKLFETEQEGTTEQKQTGCTRQNKTYPAKQGVRWRLSRRFEYRYPIRCRFRLRPAMDQSDETCRIQTTAHGH
jgi:hypothetical protein